MQAPSLRGGLRPFEDDGGNKLVHRGEREVSRKPLRREGRRDSACPCGQRAHAQTCFCAWAVGAAGTPVFPAPSTVLEGVAPGITRAESVAGTRAIVSRLFDMLKQVRGGPEAPVRAARKITAPSQRVRGRSLRVRPGCVIGDSLNWLADQFSRANCSPWERY